jgi:DNA gyrase subunit A
VDHIPDLRDGLTAAERRVLSRLGERFVKCADVVDDARGYEALVGLAQDFRRRYPLVDGRGNFGSIDGDPPAESRYTEARLAPLARALPRFPNLLVNGSAAIPPHNLREVVAAVIACIDDPDTDVPGLMEHMPGPDFPTGAVIVDPARIRAAYETGAGTITLRARSHIEGDTIIVTELPYGVDRGGDEGVFRLIADLHAERRLRDVWDLADDSDRSGMRVVIGVRRDADPQRFLNALHAHAILETTYAVDLVALVDGEPRRHTLRELIDAFLAGRDADRVRGELQDLADRFGDDRRTSLGV